MRKLITDLLALLDAGQLSITQVGYSHTRIPTTEEPGIKYWLIERPNYEFFGYIRYNGWLRHSVLVSHEDSARIDLTGKETRALKKRLYDGLICAPRLAKRLDTLLKEHQERTLAEGKQLVEQA